MERGRRYWEGAPTILVTEAPIRSRGSIGDRLVGSATTIERPLSDGSGGLPTPSGSNARVVSGNCLPRYPISVGSVHKQL